MDYNNFFTTIAGAFPQKIKDMLSEENSIDLSVEGNFIEGRHSIILNNGEQNKFDKPYTYYIHPYMDKKCSEEEIREIISCQTNAPIEKIILKTGIWNGTHYFNFNQFNVEYIQPEDDIF